MGSDRDSKRHNLKHKGRMCLAGEADMEKRSGQRVADWMSWSTHYEKQNRGKAEHSCPNEIAITSSLSVYKCNNSRKVRG
jgi:hypothetical protein